MGLQIGMGNGYLKAGSFFKAPFPSASKMVNSVVSVLPEHGKRYEYNIILFSQTPNQKKINMGILELGAIGDAIAIVQLWLVLL